MSFHLEQKMAHIPSQELLIGRGRTAEIFVWQEHQVVKLFYAGCPPEVVEIELVKSRMISAMNLPTPKFIEGVDLDGRRGLVYDRVYGISMLKMINMRPWLLLRLAKQLAELHFAIHCQDGAGFPSIRPALDSTIQWIESYPNLPANNVIKLLKDLPDNHTLCHLDFHPDQVMLTDQGPVILDWATAHQGHPLADVARTAILLKIGQAPYGGLAMRLMISLWRSLFLETYLRHYFEGNTQYNRRDLTPWLIPVAVGRLNEEIAGEKQALLGVIDNALAVLGTASP
jgi:hypothetical protein